MKITVRDCLELDAFKPCIVAAGRRNLDNVVRSVSVMDAGDVLTAVENNGVRDQIVLTSFYAMKDDVGMQAEVVRGLANCGIAGLVVFHAKNGITADDAETVEVAEAVGLPLMIIPNGNKAEYSDAIEQIMDRIIVGENFNNNLINNTIYHLLNFEKHKSFQSALREAAVSNGFQVVLISKDFNPVFVIETRHRTTVAEAVRLLQGGEESPGGRVYSLVDVEGVTGYWGAISIGSEKYFLLLVDNDDNYSAVEITKLAEIIELAVGMWKYTPERDIKAEMIKALIRGNTSLAYSLKDEMEIKGAAIVSVFYAKGIGGKSALSIIDEFEKKTGAEVLCIQEGEETYAVIIKGDGGSEPDLKAEGLQLYKRLKDMSKSIRIFHATGVDGIEGAADGFRLISEAWTFVESVFPYKRVFSKYELVLVSNCINIQVQGGHIKKNYVQLLEPFRREMGENKAKQLLDTLETFVLDAGMNSGKTSRFMGIHTNTVQYRLKRINEVLGAEITANRVIPGLTIALALKRLERGVN